MRISYFEYADLTKEAIELANRYIAEKVVGKTSVNDCRHIAIATLNKADILASWNFRHIVNLERIKGYNGVNLKCGYSIIEKIYAETKDMTQNELLIYFNGNKITKKKIGHAMVTGYRKQGKLALG